jgi:hypothetical protein
MMLKLSTRLLILRYAGLVDDKGERVYSPEVIDKMVYASAKIADYDKRIPSLSTKLIASGIDSAQIISDIVKGNVESFNEATAKIDTLDNLTDDQKLDIGQALEDIAEMSLRRSKFLQEYSDIKKAPNKYKEQRADDITTPEGEQPQTILIKTKKGEGEYEIGKEYFLGRIVEYDKNGREVYRAPRLTIIGENEDGTIKIKTSNGQVRDISKQQLQDYSLGSVENTLSNKKAKFFMEHWNTIFEFNFGKGKKKKGRLEWGEKDGKLLFTYKDDRGKIKSIEVTGNQFVARKGYNVPMIRAVGELTAVQKTALDEMVAQKDERIQKKREGRLAILEQLFDENANKQKAVEDLLNKKKSELNNIKSQIDKLKEQISKSGKEVDKRYKGIKFKSSVRTAMNTTLRLSRMQEQLEYEIKDLEVQRDDIGMVLETVTDMAEDIDSYPTSSKDFIEELNNDILNLEILEEETWKQIGSLGKLIDEVKSVLNKALDVVEDLVRDYIERFPDIVALWGDDLSFIPSKAIPVKPEHLKTLEDFIATVEDNEIKPNSEKLDVLSRQMDGLQELLKQTDDQIRTKKQILDKFEQRAKEYREQKKQEEVLKDATLIKDALGTADSGNVQTREQGR